jgi:hypothetical protein
MAIYQDTQVAWAAAGNPENVLTRRTRGQEDGKTLFPLVLPSSLFRVFVHI